MDCYRAGQRAQAAAATDRVRSTASTTAGAGGTRGCRCGLRRMPSRSVDLRRRCLCDGPPPRERVTRERTGGLPLA